jgi:hypothetical protein
MVVGEMSQVGQVAVDTVTLCASCGAETASDGAMCSACGRDHRLDGRYRLVRRLGHGAWGTTFEAVRLEDGERVAVKELLVRRLEDFKTHDLFTREASVLEMLEHRGIPRYHDDFTAGEGRHLGLYLVTELIDGVTLEAEMKERRHSQLDVIAIASELCEVLAYLHGLAPPVVHRDIKPSNVMRRATGPNAQGLVLIDFGAVKESVRSADDGGSTVAGTFGYMPPEQLAGRATPASDIYALGVLMVALMARKSASAMLDDNNRLTWQEHLPAGTPLADGLRDILGDVLELDPTRRLADARELGRRLDDLIAGRYRMKKPVLAGGLQQQLLENLPGGFGKMFAALGDQFALAKPGVAEPPPPTPRPTGFGFGGKVDPFGSFFRMFGVLFGGIPTAVLIAMASSGFPEPVAFLGLFTLVGAIMATIGFVRIARVKRLFRDGVAAEALVTDVTVDHRMKVNGRSPHRITFTYRSTDGVQREGSVARFKVRPELRVPGARVYALYDEKQPEKSTMWPIR